MAAPKLTDDPKVVEHVAKEVAKAVKAHHKKVTDLHRSGHAQLVEELKTGGHKEAAKIAAFHGRTHAADLKNLLS